MSTEEIPLNGLMQKVIATYVVESFFFSSRRRHTRWTGDWSSDVCSSDLLQTLRRFTIYGHRGSHHRLRARTPAHAEFGRPEKHRPGVRLAAHPCRCKRLDEIGRASCRDRVKIWEAHVSLHGVGEPPPA